MTTQYMEVLSDRVNTEMAREDAEAQHIEHLRDLAHVLDAQIEEGVIKPNGIGYVLAALARIYPERIHTGERCQTAECLVHGPCEECPKEADYRKCDEALTTWLAEHPREVVIHKTAGVGRSDQLPDLRPWQPAGAYPVDGTIIEVEGRPGRMRYCLDKTTANNAKNRLGGWLSDAGDDRSWFATHAPTGPWRKALSVRV